MEGPLTLFAPSDGAFARLDFANPDLGSRQAYRTRAGPLAVHVSSCVALR